MPLDYVLGSDFYQWRGAHLVRLDERFRKSAAPIGTGSPNSEDDISPWGTGFLIGEHDLGITYLVTAAHVVADKLDAPFDVRFNIRGAGARCHKIEYPDWVMHPTDSTVDAAVHQIDVPEWADVSHIPMFPNLAAGDRIRKKDIGAGCETYTVGLWRFLHGKRRNQNFVYTGHIGLMPDDEKVPVDSWLPEHGAKRIDVEAYLIEGEPLDGASGSPVFVRRTLNMDVRTRGGLNKPQLEAHAEGSVWLLGLLSDVFIGKAGEDYEVIAGEIVPRGVNVVVPIERIMEVLGHPKLKDQRAVKRESLEAKRTPMKASAHPAMDENLRHREDFNRLLGAAVQKPKQDD